MARQIEHQLDPIFQAAIDSGRVPGVAAIALDASGNVLFSKGYGVTSYGDEGASKVTIQTPSQIFSCSKLVTSIAALQLIEQKKLKLDDFVEDHVPAFAGVKVLERFDGKGNPVLRTPQTKAQVIHLMTHTAGCTYDFFDPDTLRYRIANGEIPATYGSTPSIPYYATPLKFDPGHAYNYGVNTDWLGLVVEAVSGLRLDKYVQTHILGPLGLENTSYGGGGDHVFNVHFKDANGKLTPAPNVRANTDGEIVPGGGFLTSTAEDYAQLLLTILNHGTHPISKISILQSDTVKECIFRDRLPDVGVSDDGVGEITASLPALSNRGTMLPGIAKGWSLALLTNSEDLPNGRKAGSGSWSGLANSYYWMDPVSGKLGFLLESSFPWFDKDVLHLFDALERAVYDKPAAKFPGEPGSNFSGGEMFKELRQDFAKANDD